MGIGIPGGGVWSCKPFGTSSRIALLSAGTPADFVNCAGDIPVAVEPDPAGHVEPRRARFAVALYLLGYTTLDLEGMRAYWLLVPPIMSFQIRRSG
ncbi:MAG: hypothetical protein INR62_00230 [Rhodospirillales bacterium]|nr:hypothetical protein [Acetobacter sp.]